MIKVTIRNVKPTDIDNVAAIEAACFPPAEAAGKAALAARAAAFPESFLVAETSGRLIGFINGCATDSPVIYDEMFSSTQHHNPGGKNLTIFGLDVLPDYRRQGMAALLMRHFIQTGKDAGRKNLVLTCKDRLVHYYETFGYVNQGLSKSTHGGAQWFDMTLALQTE